MKNRLAFDKQHDRELGRLRGLATSDLKAIAEDETAHPLTRILAVQIAESRTK